VLTGAPPSRRGKAALLLIGLATLASHWQIDRAAGEAGGRVAIGVYVYSADNPQRLDRYARQAGRSPLLVSSYKQWPLNPFPRDELETIWRSGALPLVAWEPWTYEHRAAFPLRRIAAGDFDRYIHRTARIAAAWGRPIMLRFAHEMNGDWYPWGRNRDGSTARDYRAAWRKLVRIFEAEGADEVEWVWTPNVNASGDLPFQRFFPGDEWVDWVGLDGFNWGEDGQWPSFTEVFGNSYDSLARLSSRPVIVAETGVSEDGGDKAAWLSSALRREIPRFERLRAVVWFSEPFEGVDVRVDSSPASLQAYRSGIATPPYQSTRSDLLATPRSFTSPTAAPEPPDGGFGEPSFLYRLLAKLHGRNLVYAVAAGLACLLVFAATLLVGRRLIHTSRIL
jgi:Glycosyl hydrolase family 26